MKVHVSESAPQKLDEFFTCAETHFIYPTPLYQDMILSAVTGEIKVRHITVEDDNGVIVGYLPTMVRINEEHGNVLNALPYFGSSGSLLAQKDLDDETRFAIKMKLLEGVESVVSEFDCVVSCVITSPFDTLAQRVKDTYKPDFNDHRIGQITPLQKYDEESLFYAFSHGKRYSYKKALKHCIVKELTANDVDTMYTMHVNHMKSINGTPKDKSFFEYIMTKMSNVVTVKGAYVNDELIAYVIFFYYGDVVNYYLTAYTADNFKYEGTTLIIVDEMKHALHKGCEYFDFGGTWESQKNVYFYKQKFAAEDMPYYYLIKEHRDNKLRTIGKEKILSEYTFFYVLPFSVL